jgi:hypothetical protein
VPVADFLVRLAASLPGGLVGLVQLVASFLLAASFLLGGLLVRGLARLAASLLGGLVDLHHCWACVAVLGS